MAVQVKSSSVPSTKLSSTERLALVLPLVGGVVFGIFPFLLGGAFGSILGYPGNDSFAYRLAGAATFGYAVALVLGLRQDNWAPLRLVVIATLTFNIASIYACVAAIAAGGANIIVYLIFGTSIAITAITFWALNRHKDLPAPMADLSKNFPRIFAVGTVFSGLFGLGGLFIGAYFGQLFGFKGTELFLYRQAGAASLGYAVMAIYAMRSNAWVEARLPMVMAAVFNALSFIGSVVAIASGEPTLLTIVIGLVSLLVTIGTLVILQRNGKVLLDS
jgi:hypothetical protein